MSNKTSSYYQALGLNENATREQVEEAYRKYASEHHPHKLREQLRESERKFQEASDAYRYLTSSEEQRQSDISRQQANQSALDQVKETHRGFNELARYHNFLFDPFEQFNSLFNRGFFGNDDFGLTRAFNRFRHFGHEDFLNDEFFYDDNDLKVKNEEVSNNPSTPEEKNFTYTNKSYSSHMTVDEEGNKKVLVNKKLEKDGNVKEVKFEKNYDKQGNVSIQYYTPDNKPIEGLKNPAPNNGKCTL